MSNEADLTHLTAERIQGFLDGALPAGEVTDVQRHVTSCSRCQAELESWRIFFSELGAIEHLEPAATLRESVLAQLGEELGAVADSRVEALLAGLGHYQPTPAFAARVMESWRHEAAGRATQQPTPLAALVRKAAAFTGRLVPRTRHAWAVISGVAVTPASVIALMAYAVFSNPLATPASLAQFAWWRVSGVISALSETIPGLLLDSTATVQAYSAFEYVSSSPLVAVGGALSFTFLTCSAVWVLYKNLLPARAVDQSYARITA